MPTKLQSLLKVRREFKAGRLGAMHNGACVYEARNGDHCSVGCLFGPAQIADLKRRRLNSNNNVNDLMARIGSKNLKAVTGMTMVELTHMQNQHDDSFILYGKTPGQKFGQWLDREIGKVRS